MIGAFIYLQSHSMVNRLRVRFKRLKQPKYLAGAIVGVLYLYFYFFRFLLQNGRSRGSPVFALDPDVLEMMAALVIAVLLAGGWILPNKRAALSFSEAEIAFLFPAPVSRRRLIQFKLLRSQGSILFSVLIFTLLSGRFAAGGTAWIRAIGWWIIFSTVSLNLLGVSFLRSKWFGFGSSPGDNRRLRLILFLGIVIAVAVSTSSGVWLPQLDPKDLAASIHRWLRRPPIFQFLFPFRLVVRPFLARSPADFLTAIGPALLILLLHYEWVVRSNVAFEEASVEAARRTAELMEANPNRRVFGDARARKSRRAPFHLRPHGPAPTAFLWKSLIGAGQSFSIRGWLAALLVSGTAVWWLRASELAVAIRSFLFGILVLSFFFFPQLLRLDLREDLAVADLLKTLPVPGWKIVAGELLGPVFLQTAIQYTLLFLLALSFAGGHSSTRQLPAGVAAAVVLLLPFGNTLLFFVANAAVVLFPAWVQVGKEGARGIEATGQRLIFVFGQLLVIVLSAIPAAAAFAAGYFSFILVQPALALFMGMVGAMAMLAGEIALAVLWLGRQFEKLDISKELPM